MWPTKVKEHCRLKYAIYILVFLFLLKNVKCYKLGMTLYFFYYYYYFQITDICTAIAQALSGVWCVEAAASTTWSAVNAPCRGHLWAMLCPAAATPSTSATPASSIRVKQRLFSSAHDFDGMKRDINILIMIWCTGREKKNASHLCYGIKILMFFPTVIKQCNINVNLFRTSQAWDFLHSCFCNFLQLY